MVPLHREIRFDIRLAAMRTEKSAPRHQPWPWISLGTLVLGFAAGAWMASGSESRSGHTEVASSAADAIEAPRSQPEVRLPAPVNRAPAMPAPAVPDNAANTPEERARRQVLAKELTTTLRTRIQYYEKHSPPGSTPEDTAQHMGRFAEGWAEALMVLAPELVEEEVSATISEGMCDPETSDAELMVLSHLDRALPDTLKAGAVDCVIDRKQENLALWTVLDSWRRTGKPLTPAMQALAQNAQDPRTKRRFMSRDEESALRAQAGVGVSSPMPADSRGPAPQAPEHPSPEHP